MNFIKRALKYTAAPIALLIVLSMVAAPANAAPKDKKPKPPKTTTTTTAKPKPTTTTTVKPTTTTTLPTTTTTIPSTPPLGSSTALVLYDSSGQWGYLGELYGTMVANLTGHFGSYKALPISSYTAGLMDSYTATIYLGSTYDEALPSAFLTDVPKTKSNVIWAYDNIWQETAANPNFVAQYGFTWKGFDFSSVTSVSYKNQTLTRNVLNNSGIMDYVISDPSKVQILATAKRADGTTLPWAVRSGNLTYIGEIPFAYANQTDRQLIFSDLLFDALAPNTVSQHRALVRLEDIGPDSDPADIKRSADVLYANKVPFSMAVYTQYEDPLGFNNNGKPESYNLNDMKPVIDAIKYAQARGGTVVMHGYTHQYSNVKNPYDGVSADDFEFFTSHLDASNNVVYDGPIPNDSANYVTTRVAAADLSFATAGIKQPTIFEAPHYAMSALDYQTIAKYFPAAYDNRLYYAGTLSGKTADPTKFAGQFFPYVVKDIYGTKVLPEDMGNYEPEAQNNHPARLVPDLLVASQDNLVIRDGFASFFFHPYYDSAELDALVKGVKAQGYTFADPNTL